MSAAEPGGYNWFYLSAAKVNTAGRCVTVFIKHILFENFWSFLLVLSGVVDIGIGVILVFTDGKSFSGPPLPVFVICFITGAVYLSLGIVIALVRLRRKRK